jgi:hypothetical protein
MEQERVPNQQQLTLAESDSLAASIEVGQELLSQRREARPGSRLQRAVVGEAKAGSQRIRLVQCGGHVRRGITLPPQAFVGNEPDSLRSQQLYVLPR